MSVESSFPKPDGWTDAWISFDGEGKRADAAPDGIGALTDAMKDRSKPGGEAESKASKAAVAEYLWLLPHAEDVKALAARGIEAECFRDRADYTGKKVVIVTPAGNLYAIAEAPEIGEYVLENGAVDLKFIVPASVNGKPDPDFFGKWPIVAMEKALEHASWLPPRTEETGIAGEQWRRARLFRDDR